jgi:hypothetical protein
MPSLADALRGRDLGFLKMAANAWGLELNAPDAATGLPQLVNGILGHQWREDVIDTLPHNAQAALQALLQSEGSMSWALFTRRFGELRPFGPGKREKERPDLKPVSATEALYYRALISRAFLKREGDAEREQVEYAFIPDDLLEVLQPLVKRNDAPPGRPASPSESAHPILSSDRILDHATTLLAALRLGMSLNELSSATWNITPALLLELLKSARLVDDANQPQGEPLRAFLEAPRGKALSLLANEWMEALYLNELRLLPGLKCEGDWLNDPLRARQAVLKWLGQVPVTGSWWSLASFVKTIREHDPDFQRPAGDYDSWFIRQESNGAFLRGFSSWDEVDGALVRFLVCVPLFALGFLDLASAEPGGEVSAFRFTAWAEDLLHNQAPAALPEETGKLKLTTSGLILLPRLTPRAARYNIARFCQWENETGEEYRYRVTPSSLERASSQALRPRQLITLLRKHTDGGVISPVLTQALERWETSGTQVVLERVCVLRVTSPEILAALKKSRAARYLLDELSPTLILVREGTEDKILEALSEIGYLGEARFTRPGV